MDKKYKVWWYWCWRIQISLSQVVFNKLLFGKQHFKYAKEIDIYAYSVQKWVYKRGFDKTKCMNFFGERSEIFRKL